MNIPKLVRGGEFHLGWHQTHIEAMLSGTSPYFFVLIPSDKDGKLDFFHVEAISDSGRPSRTVIASPLQLATPRDPNTTQPGRYPGEVALIAALQARAAAAAYVLPKIVPSLYWPTWSRYPLNREQRGVLMRGGA